MKFTQLAIPAATLILSSIAFGNDSPGQAPKPMKQRVHECVTQTMAADASMSRKAAVTSCKEKVKNAEDPTGTNRVGSGTPDKP